MTCTSSIFSFFPYFIKKKVTFALLSKFDLINETNTTQWHIEENVNFNIPYAFSASLASFKFLKYLILSLGNTEIDSPPPKKKKK